MRTASYVISLLLAIPVSAAAEVIPEGSGIIFGPNHSFTLTAPKGWSLDNTSGAKSGLSAVFFPQGSSWAKSTVVAYANSRPIDGKVKTVKDAVDAVIAQFHAKGSPNYKAKKDKEIKTDNGKTGVVYNFTGDKYGNFEAVCYFKEEKTINFIVLSSRKKDAFDGAREPFLSLCKSYTFVTDKIEIKNSKKENDSEAAKPAAPAPSKKN